MASNLYELLGVAKDATSEQIRKAYKRSALQTHPDKLPLGLGEEEKTAAGERFRQISHACEILTDPEKRREYDIHGIWPPPQPEEGAFDAFFSNDGPARQRGHRSHTFPSPFSTYHHHHAYPNFMFRDPFELFDSIFKEFEGVFRPPRVQPFTPFDTFNILHGQQSRGLFPESIIPPMPPIPVMTLAPLQPRFEHNPNSQGSFHSESFITQTINGITQTIHTRCDNDGNEHITRRYPDGVEVYTINGVQQSTRGYLSQDPSESRLSSQSQDRPHHRSTMPSYPNSQHTQPRQRDAHNSNNYGTSTQQPTRYPMQSFSRREYEISPPPYPTSNDSHRRYDQTPVADRHEPRRRDMGPYVADGHSELIYDVPWYGDRHRRKSRPSNHT